MLRSLRIIMMYGKLWFQPNYIKKNLLFPYFVPKILKSSYLQYSLKQSTFCISISCSLLYIVSKRQAIKVRKSISLPIGWTAGSTGAASVCFGSSPVNYHKIKIPFKLSKCKTEPSSLPNVDNDWHWDLSGCRFVCNKV